MNSGELSQFTDHWYVTAGDGDAVVRVFPGMSLGETETGELSLDGGDALLSLSIGSDESLVVFVVNGGELESEDGEFSGKRHFAFDSTALISLPNNVLRFDKGILNEAGTEAPSIPRVVWRTAGAENQAPAIDSVEEVQAPLESEFTEPEIIVSEVNAPERNTLEHDEAPGISVPIDQQILPKNPGKTTASRKQRKSSLAVAASAGLVCVLIGLVYAGMRIATAPEQPAPIARQIDRAETSRQTAVQAAVEETPFVEQTPAIEEAPSVAETPAIREALTVAPPDRDEIFTETKSASATTASETAVVTTIPTNELTADDITSTQVSAVAEPVTQSIPTPEVATVDAARAAAEAKSRREQERAQAALAESRRKQQRAQAALEASRREQEQAQAALEASRREQERAQTALVRYERDLLAAELALAQGRLTQPPENSAFSLYKQLVASNPESSEAKRGFQAVGAALVNRAFAELAAKRWSDAQATLAAAAEAGASPSLVNDLSGEVVYQQRLADAEAGRFATLYPAAELVALKRTTPRLRRYAPDDIDMVQIEFTISIAGNVQDIEVLGGPSQRLERAVREAVTDWRFEPVLSGTRPIPVRTRVGLEIP